MKTSEFDYTLPDGFIAQYPAERREEARLLVLDRNRPVLEHSRFDRIAEYIDPGDVLVLNETKVIPARIFGTREGTGGKVEVLLLKEIEKDVWEALANPAKRAKEGSRITFDGHGSCEVAAVLDTGKRLLKFDSDVRDLMNSRGSIPLPPYIKREPEQIDGERYQTVYAMKEGSVAAPTAGLHFTQGILSAIREKADVAFITLHVGMGTFKPIKKEEISEHLMETEYYEIPEDAAKVINRRKGKVIAVGTSVVRSLESSGSSGRVKAGAAEASLFIYPPYEFKIVGRMITNFHLPRATTFVLTAAFAGLDRLKSAYMEAVGRGYRFYSYGDAMIIL